MGHHSSGGKKNKGFGGLLDRWLSNNSSAKHGSRGGHHSNRRDYDRAEDYHDLTTSATAPNNCMACNTPNPPGNKFCGGCGKSLESIEPFCHQCGKALSTNSQFCGNCGTKAN